MFRSVAFIHFQFKTEFTSNMLFLVCWANLMFQFHIVYIVTDIIGFYINGKSQHHFNVDVGIEFGRVYSHTSRRFAFTSRMNRVRWKLCKKKLPTFWDQKLLISVFDGGLWEIIFWRIHTQKNHLSEKQFCTLKFSNVVGLTVDNNHNFSNR